MRYATLGEIPPKRHSQVWREGDRSNGANGSRRLLVEEVLGYEGFSGNESILYHLNSPCRLDEVGAFVPITREAWVPDAHVHRLADTRPIAASGHPISSRRLLMFNNDIEVWLAKPDAEMEGFYRNGEGDEVVYIHRGAGVLHSVFGSLAFRERDYVVVPRGTTHRWDLEPGTEQHWLIFHTPG